MPAAHIFLMPDTLHIHIYDKSGREFGPFHWKHIVEWNELSLLGGFYWKTSGGKPRSIQELVDIVGVPPSILTRSIFLQPPDDAPDATPESMTALHAAGFPESIRTIAAETQKHVAERLALSSAVLDAEDADFKVGDPFGGKGAPAAKQETGKETEPEPESKEKTGPGEAPEPDDVPDAASKIDGKELAASEQMVGEAASEEMPESETVAPAEARDSTAAETTRSAEVNPLLEGEEVDPNQVLEPDEIHSGKKRSAAIPTAAVLLLFIGVGVVIFLTFRSGTSSSDEMTPTAADAASPAMEKAVGETPTIPNETVSAAADQPDAVAAERKEETPQAKTEPSEEAESPAEVAVTAKESTVDEAATVNAEPAVNEGAVSPEEQLTTETPPAMQDESVVSDVSSTGDDSTETDESSDAVETTNVAASTSVEGQDAQDTTMQEDTATEPLPSADSLAANPEPAATEAGQPVRGVSFSTPPADTATPPADTTTPPATTSAPREDTAGATQAQTEKVETTQAPTNAPTGAQTNDRRENAQDESESRPKREELIEEFPDYVPSF